LFREGSEGEGAIALNAGFDGVVRKVRQVYAVGGGVYAPGLALEMMRVASGAGAIRAQADENGVHSVALMAGNDPLFVIPTEPDGALRPWFGPRDLKREVPAIRLLTDDSALELLEGKYVLVGYSAAGGLDERLSPLEELNPGVDAHRQVLEAVFENRLLTRPDYAPPLEAVVAVVLILAAAMAPSRLGLLAGGGVLLVAFALPLGVTLVAYLGWLHAFDGATPAFGALVAGVPAFGAAVAVAERDRRRAEAARARLDGEMAAAKRIQIGILPDTSAAFPGETRFQVAASSEPARTVGGDLYDVFLLDDRRLFFIVGDVAGKGPEASLFMAIAKVLCKSAALRDPPDLGGLLSKANEEIARDNPATMFVTAFAGVLDVETGDLEYCSAGHEPPWLVSGGLARRLEGEGGPPLCLLDDWDYPTDRTTLAPGDILVVVTDGVTEAADTEGALFGTERTDAAVAAAAAAPDAPGALQALTDPVRRFARGAEQADDLTAMVVVWRGGG